MHSYNGAYASRLFRLLRMADINFVANPLVNIHLQGRFDTYPKRRGITRVKEMLEANINVCFGHDDVFDPWYPMGTANMLQVQDRYGIEVGKPANLLILPVENGFDAVRRQVPVRYSIRHGRVIADTRPAETTLHLVNPERVDFRR